MNIPPTTELQLNLADVAHFLQEAIERHALDADKMLWAVAVPFLMPDGETALAVRFQGNLDGAGPVQEFRITIQPPVLHGR